MGSSTDVSSGEAESKEAILLQFCRICLAMNSKTYKMSEKDELFDHYRLVSGILLNDDGFPAAICWECRYLLMKCFKFRAKCQASHNILMDILKYNDNKLTAESILRVDRNLFNLSSTLNIYNIDSNHSDLHIIDQNQQSAKEQKMRIKQETKEESVTLIPASFTMLPKQEVEIDFLDNDNEGSIIAESLSTVKMPKTKKKTAKVLKKTKKKAKPKVESSNKKVHIVINQNLFTIVEMNLEQQKEEIQKRKESLNYQNSTFKCMECFKGFLDEEAFKSHYIKHTDQCGTYICEVCRTHFRNTRALKNHIALHRTKYSCKRCVFVTSARYHAKLHEDLHNGTKYQCPHCPEDFVKHSTYMGHIRIKHPSDFVCQLCGHSFVSQKGLGLHKNLKHKFEDKIIPEDGPFCDVCNIKFISEEALEKHLVVSAKHPERCDSKPVSRQRPRRSYDNLGQKIKKSTQEGPIQCEQCEEQFPDYLTYSRHFRKMHPDKNRTNYSSLKTKSMCEICGGLFQSLAALQEHSSAHLEEATFRCEVCGKMFKRRYNLAFHSRLHRRERQKRYPCPECGKQYSTSGNRQKHMVSHTGLKLFKCELCGKSFRHASEKRAHVTYVHLKKPWPKRSRGNRAERQTMSAFDHE